MKRKIAGFLLAGGRNTRMGGEKKAFLEWNGIAFYEWCRNAMDELDEVYLSVEDEAPYQRTGMKMVKDHYPGTGPLGAVCSGMEEADAEALLVLPCDVPKIQKEMIRKLAACYNETGSLVIIRTKDRPQPLIGVYPVRYLPVFQRWVRKGCYRMMGILSEIPHLELETGADELYENINRPEDYRRLTGEE